MINYKTGSLFDAPSGFLAHACNGMGVWGSGIALEFKNRFPKTFTAYSYYCKMRNVVDNSARGTYLLSELDSFKIICLITSHGYGPKKDSAGYILQNTHKAVTDFLYQYPNAIVNSPKINAGLFGVPWELTERTINDILKLYPNATWNVWVPNA